MRLRTILIAVGLGLLTTLLVPRVMRWLSRNTTWPAAEVRYAAGIPSADTLVRTEDADLTTIEWTSTAVARWDNMPEADDIRALAQRAAYAADVPPPAAPGAQPVVAQIMIVEQGFPFRATWGWERLFSRPGGGRRSGNFDDGGMLRLNLGHAAFRLTYLPLWPGLLANTVIFGGAWYLVIAGVSYTKRRPPARGRAACPACGHWRVGMEAFALCPQCRHRLPSPGPARPS